MHALFNAIDHASYNGAPRSRSYFQEQMITPESTNDCSQEQTVAHCAFICPILGNNNKQPTIISDLSQSQQQQRPSIETHVPSSNHHHHLLHLLGNNRIPNSHQIDPIGYGLGDTTLAICTNKPLRMQVPTSGITWDHHEAPYG